MANCGSASVWSDSLFLEIHPYLLNQVCADNCCDDLCFKELQQREEIISKKEMMLSEKNELEMKKLRSSQNVARVSTRH